MICAGKPAAGEDTCYGDSGGPLFARKPQGGYVQVGIVSWGEDCGRGEEGLYGLYTRVAKFNEWIQGTIGK